MNVKQPAIVGALGLALLLLVGCEEYATYTPSAADLTRIAEEMPPGPTKDMIQGTAVARYIAAAKAEQTITAAQAVERAARAELERQTAVMTAEAESTIAAQQNAAWATTQALDARATTQALDATATALARAAGATATAESRNATATATAAIYQATAEARDATTTADIANATATMQAAVDAVEKTAQAAQAVMLQATAAAVQRQSEREEAVQGVRTAAPWVGLVLAVTALIILGWYLAPVTKARLQVIRRKADEGEPFMVLERERVKLPLRGFGPDGNEAPTPDFQDRVTARAQLPAVVAAAQSRRGQVRRMRRHPAPSSPVIRVVEPDDVRPWIEDARAQLIAEGVTDGDL